MITTDQSFALIRQVQNGDTEACGRLIEENNGLIWSITRRYMGRGVETEDLYQLGCIGFIKAVKSFDLDYGTKFSTYAVPKIAGEIRRFLRDDGPIKVSRTVKEKAILISRSRNTLLTVLGREPTLCELSEETGLTPAEIAGVETATAQPESLCTSDREDGFTLETVLGSQGEEAGIMDRLSIRAALQSLPQKERTVIELRYFRDLTQEKTAKILGVSQVQVSRLERRAVKALRQLLE